MVTETIAPSEPKSNFGMAFFVAFLGFSSAYDLLSWLIHGGLYNSSQASYVQNLFDLILVGVSIAVVLSAKKERFPLLSNTFFGVYFLNSIVKHLFAREFAVVATLAGILVIIVLFNLYKKRTNANAHTA